MGLSVYRYGRSQLKLDGRGKKEGKRLRQREDNDRRELVMLGECCCNKKRWRGQICNEGENGE